MSSIVKQSLFAVALLSVAMVEAAPLDSTTKSASKTSAGNKATSKTKSYLPSGKITLKRGKRNVIIEEIPTEDIVVAPTEEDVLRDQLADLSDDQLAMLAEIVQNEVNRYEPGLEEYEIVEIPEYVTRPYEYEYMPRDRRAAAASASVYDPYTDQSAYIPEELIDDSNDELILVPEEALIEAAREEQDELELRERIAEIANILNERASRRLRYI